MGGGASRGKAYEECPPAIDTTPPPPPPHGSAPTIEETHKPDSAQTLEATKTIEADQECSPCLSETSEIKELRAECDWLRKRVTNLDIENANLRDAASWCSDAKCRENGGSTEFTYAPIRKDKVRLSRLARESRVECSRVADIEKKQKEKQKRSVTLLEDTPEDRPRRLSFAADPVSLASQRSSADVFCEQLAIATSTSSCMPEAYTLFAWMNWSPPPDSECSKTLHRCFPTAVPGSVVLHRSRSTLESLGFTPDNAIYGQSICPDEINNEMGDLANTLQQYWGECFPMGGIGGCPFVGKTGFSAFSNHVPEDGHVLILFGPHIAVSDAGELGKYLRHGQRNTSSACGAVLGAYSAVKQGTSLEWDEDDMQQTWIKNQVAANLEEIDASEDPLKTLIYSVYESIKTKLLNISNTKFGSGKLAIIGGIQINMPQPYEDHFQPLCFNVMQEGQPTLDMLSCFQENFTYTGLNSSDILSGCCLDIFSWLELSPPRGSRCLGTLQECYPRALPGTAVVSRTTQVLASYGLTPENSIFGHSICPDEINNEESDLGSRMGSYWGECFPMGGLGGPPFVGRTGFNAFAHHVPTEGHVVILFGPHIAISGEGELGQYLRTGQHEHSAACGAVLAAYEACKHGDTTVGEFDFTDMQQSWLKDYISKMMTTIESSPNPLRALSYSAYACVKEKLLAIVSNNFGKGKLVLIGGIQINLPAPHEDHFQPLMFEMWEGDELKTDLMPSLT